MSTHIDVAPETHPVDHPVDQLAGPAGDGADLASGAGGGSLAAQAGLDALAQVLVAQARASGIALSGPGGLLSELTARVLETALQAELSEHLGHQHGGVPGADGNVRNGHTSKTVRTEIGPVRIRVPRDRAGSFEPVLVPKHARRLSGFDEQVISLYAKGMTTGDIANHLGEVYGSRVSRDLVWRVTDALVAQMTEWANRPLEPGRRSLETARSTRYCWWTRFTYGSGMGRSLTGRSTSPWVSPSRVNVTSWGCGSGLPVGKGPSSGPAC